MDDKPKVLAVIPARGGSKGVPQKNIRNLCGMPLIGYTIRVALKSRLIDRVLVSTESEEVAEVSRSLGAEVPFLRPEALARDDSLIGDAVFFTVDKLREENFFPNVVVTLYPTHPFRTVGLVDELIEKNLQGYSPVSTVKRIVHTNLSAFSRTESGELRPLVRKNMQEREEECFYRNYALYVGANNTYVDKPYIKVVDNPISLIDIDTVEDFRLAEHIVMNDLFNFQTE